VPRSPKWFLLFCFPTKILHEYFISWVCCVFHPSHLPWFVTFHNMLMVGAVCPLPNPQAEASSCIICPQLLIHYIHSHPSYLEAVSSVCNLRMCHAVVTRDPLNISENVSGLCMLLVWNPPGFDHLCLLLGHLLWNVEAVDVGTTAVTYRVCWSKETCYASLYCKCYKYITLIFITFVLVMFSSSLYSS